MAFSRSEVTSWEYLFSAGILLSSCLLLSLWEVHYPQASRSLYQLLIRNLELKKCTTTWAAPHSFFSIGTYRYLI